MGVERMTAEDLASEAIAKALAKEMAFESADHVFNWTMLVAKNLWIDQRRAAARAPEVYDLSDVDVPTHDTAHVAEYRMQLRRVLEVLAGMSPDDRYAVMTDVTPAGRTEAVRLNVRRHRARARLRAALAGVAALLGLRRLPRTATTAATPVALATALLTVWLPSATPVIPPDRGAAPAPVERLDGVDRAARRRPAELPAPRAVRPAGAPAPDATRLRPRPQRQRVAAAKVAGREAYVDTWSEPNHPDRPLLCVDNNRLGHVCVDLP